MSNQPKRQRCQPKKYTETEYERQLRKSITDVTRQCTKIYMASFALALHRKLGIEPEKVLDALEETSRISCDALCFTDVCKAVMDETGIDLSDLLSEDNI